MGINRGETFWQDVRFGFRMLCKNPGFTALAVLTLGLGIGATSTLFGVFNSLILNPFPYPRAGNLHAHAQCRRWCACRGV